MSRSVFADAYYWIALTSPQDEGHETAERLAKELDASLVEVVTTEETLTEYLTFFAGRPRRVRTAAGDNVQRILKDPGVRVIPQSHGSFLGALRLYIARPDKGYSLPDCALMIAMREEGATDVLTADQHFVQEGFRSLLAN